MKQFFNRFVYIYLALEQSVAVFSYYPSTAQDDTLVIL